MPFSSGDRRGGVGERLDGTARLLQGEGHIDMAVNRIIMIIDTAQHGQNLARARL